MNCPRGSSGTRVLCHVSDDIHSLNVSWASGPRTMQDLGSVQHLYFLVTSFPIGLSPRTMKDLGSV